MRGASSQDSLQFLLPNPHRPQAGEDEGFGGVGRLGYVSL